MITWSTTGDVTRSADGRWLLLHYDGRSLVYRCRETAAPVLVAQRSNREEAKAAAEALTWGYRVSP